MKLWSFDAIYRRQGGQYLSHQDVEEGLRPFREIRQRVGDRIELVLDGHGFFSLAAATRILEAIEEIRPLWVEDILRPDSLHAMTTLRQRTKVPIAVSEMLVMTDHYRQVLDNNAADYVMVDPTWVGGISATKRIAELAQLYNVPTLMHDCTGPLTMLAGVHITASNTGVAFQETVRAHFETLYPLLIDTRLTIENGHLPLPETPGLGAKWLDELFATNHPGYRITREE